MSGAPDLTALVGGRRTVLVVDAATPPGCAAVADAFPQAPRVRQDSVAGSGLPGSDGEECSLEPPEGGLDALVLVDVLDRVLDGPYALRAALRLVPPDGCLVLVQQLSPDDASERAAWNALARMRDGRHTWSPTSRQLRAMLTSLPARRAKKELEWTEVVDPGGGCRADAEGLLATYVAALATGGGPLEEGRLPVRRVALALRPGR